MDVRAVVVEAGLAAEPFVVPRKRGVSGMHGLSREPHVAPVLRAGIASGEGIIEVGAQAFHRSGEEIELTHKIKLETVDRRSFAVLLLTELEAGRLREAGIVFDERRDDSRELKTVHVLVEQSGGNDASAAVVLLEHQVDVVRQRRFQVGVPDKQPRRIGVVIDKRYDIHEVGFGVRMGIGKPEIGELIEAVLDVYAR